jgi:hypothetical protein
LRHETSRRPAGYHHQKDIVLYAARYCFPGTNVYMISIVYLSLMVPTNLPFHLAFVGWRKLRPTAAQA